MAAIERTIVQAVADAWGNDTGGVAVLVTDHYTDKPTTRDLTPDEARQLAVALIAAADAVTDDTRDAAEEPQEPRGDTITPSTHRRAGGAAKTPQIAAEAQQPEVCGDMCSRPRGHADACHPEIRW